MSEDNALPVGWVETTLGDICSKPQYGWTTKAQQQNGLVKLLRTTDISAGSINWDTVPYCTEVPDNLDDYKLEVGDIVISRAGSVGISFLLKYVPIGALFASYLIRFRPYQDIDAQYLAYYLRHPNYWNFISEQSSGIALANVNARKLEILEIPLAPTNEQLRIVATIEQQFTRLDAAVEVLKRAQKKLTLYRSAVLKAAVEGKLTADWRTKHLTAEPAPTLLKRILQERRAKWEADQLAKWAARGVVPKDEKWKEAYKEPAQPDREGLPELPEGWCWATFDQIADITGGVTKGRNLTGRATVTLPYLRVANVQRYFLDLSVMKTIEIPQDEVEKYLLRDGDILMIEGGDADKLGRAALWKNEISPCIHQNHIFRSRLQNKDVLPMWLVLYANSERGQSYFLNAAKQTVNLASINLTQLKNCPIALLPLAEQEQIVALVEEQLSIISDLETTVEHSLKRAERQRQSILREAFAGRLVAQDAEDEPASVLLERIREERKRREEEERRTKKQRGSTKMASQRTATNKQRKPLREVLQEAKQPITPDDLFRRAGFQVNDVDEFFEDLRMEVKNGGIRQVRPDDTSVLLEAVGE